jgi:hypothetical protein
LVTAEQFRQVLRETAAADLYGVVDEYLFTGVPYIFEDNTPAYTRFRRVVARALNVGTADVGIVGSARTGFSLSPGKPFEPFGPSSDVDVLVVSERLFDMSWMEILSAGSRVMTGTERRYIQEHRERHWIYGGWVWPDRITGVLVMGTAWFRAFRDLPRVTGILEHEFGGRVFRTWEHARLYYMRSLLEIQSSLEASSQMKMEESES